MRVIAPIRARAGNAGNQRKNCANSRQITANLVFARTSAPDGPPQAPTFAAASHQKAPASPPLTNASRSALSTSARLPRARSQGFSRHSLALPALTQEGSAVEGSPATRHCLSLIYGTAIKNPRISFNINEYKVLIYGKPLPQRFCSSTAGIPTRAVAIAPNTIDLPACLPYACSLKALQIIAIKPRAPLTGRRKENHPAWRT